MANVIIKRCIDETGRVVIPKYIRKKLKLNERDELDMLVINDEVRIRKSKDVCSFCGNKKNLIKHMEEYICRNCLGKITEG